MSQFARFVTAVGQEIGLTQESEEAVTSSSSCSRITAHLAQAMAEKKKVTADLNTVAEQLQLVGHKYRIQTDARVITGNKDQDKKPRPQAEVFYFEVFISCNHEGEVCILFK